MIYSSELSQYQVFCLSFYKLKFSGIDVINMSLSSNLVHGEVYLIQHYVIKFVKHHIPSTTTHIIYIVYQAIFKKNHSGIWFDDVSVNRDIRNI